MRDHCRFLWGPPLKGVRAQSTRDFISSALLALLGIAFNVLLVLGLLFVHRPPTRLVHPQHAVRRSAAARRLGRAGCPGAT